MAKPQVVRVIAILRHLPSGGKGCPLVLDILRFNFKGSIAIFNSYALCSECDCVVSGAKGL